MGTLYIKASSPWSTIQAWQKFLNHHVPELRNKLTEDGIWGRHTVDATCDWQADNGLSVDGKVGYNSFKKATDQGFKIPPVPNLPGKQNNVIDISHHQGLVEFGKVKGAGIRVIIQKATEGITFKDISYPHNRSEARKEGFLWAAYHFLNGEDGAKQAEFFWDYARPDGNTVVALDYEASDATIQSAVEWVNWIVKMSGKSPLIYGGRKLKTDLRQASVTDRTIITNCPLWLSHYTIPEKVVLPPGWDQYTFWQYSGHAEMPGIGFCDRDFFNEEMGTLEHFWEMHGM